jgi:hypothetical protein
MAQLNPPRIRVGGLSRDVYVVTHGHERGGVLEATRKYKATADFEDVARELGWLPPEEKS